jgi:hypothetical protein
MKSSNNEENDQNPSINNHVHPRSDYHHRVYVRAHTRITTNRGAVDIHPDSLGAHRRAVCFSHKSSANHGAVDGGRGNGYESGQLKRDGGQSYEY